MVEAMKIEMFVFFLYFTVKQQGQHFIPVHPQYIQQPHGQYHTTTQIMVPGTSITAIPQQVNFDLILFHSLPMYKDSTGLHTLLKKLPVRETGDCVIQGSAGRLTFLLK